MAATGLLALLDDIAALTKIAARKTVGISGDDLAVNAHVLAGGGGGIDPKREIPMVMAVAKGSLKNKFFYLIPGAMALSVAAPWAIAPLMMAGGAFLAYEGVEKMLHKDKHEHESAPKKDPKTLEAEKVAGAIKTDFILSAEIVVVALGAMASAPFLAQLGALAAIGVGMTVGIYGLVGGLVKLDDIGLKLAQSEGDDAFSTFKRSFGKGLVKAVPPLMKGLSFLGTAAMFAVGGGILMHGIPGLEHAVTGLAHLVTSSPMLVGMIETAATMATGIVAGVLAIPAVTVLKEPVMHIAGLAKDFFEEKIKGPVTGFAKSLLQRVYGHPVPGNDNAPAAPVAEASADALKSVPDVKAALNTAAPKAEQGLPAEVKPAAPAFKGFEKMLNRNFGK